MTRKKKERSDTLPPPENDRPTLEEVEPADAAESLEDTFAATPDVPGSDEEGVATPRGPLADVDAERDDADVEPARELTETHLRGLLEALVFASDKPMKTGELARLASAPNRQVREAMSELKAEYSARGIVLDEVAGGWLFRTNAQYAPFVRELAGGRPVKLSRAQLETLAIAAYRQPITRPEIDEIRGVDSGATLKLLLERDLVRILGKKDEPGRPLLYGTTGHFLEFFNMKSLKDLPTLREFTELSDESLRVAEAELGQVLPDMAAPTPPAPPPAAEPEPETEPEREPEDEDSMRETVGPPPVGPRLPVRARLRLRLCLGGAGAGSCPLSARQGYQPANGINAEAELVEILVVHGQSRNLWQSAGVPGTQGQGEEVCENTVAKLMKASVRSIVRQAVPGAHFDRFGAAIRRRWPAGTLLRAGAQPGAGVRISPTFHWRKDGLVSDSAVIDLCSRKRSWDGRWPIICGPSCAGDAAGDGVWAAAAGRGSAASQRPRRAVLRPVTPTDAEREGTWRCSDERPRRLLGQRGDGELFQDAQDGVGVSPQVCHTCRGDGSDLRVRRGFLQSQAAALEPGLCEPRGVRGRAQLKWRKENEDGCAGDGLGLCPKPRDLPHYPPQLGRWRDEKKAGREHW